MLPPTSVSVPSADDAGWVAMVSVYTPDLDRTVAFYRDVLGLDWFEALDPHGLTLEFLGRA